MSIIDIAFSGAQAAQSGLNVTSMNIANMLTPGFSRQRIEQSAIGPMGYAGLNSGNGVQVDSIRRVSDQYLVSQVWRTNSKSTYYAGKQEYLGPLEAAVGTDTSSLGTGLDQFFSSLSELTTQPDDRALRQQVLNEAQTLATRFNNVNGVIDSQKTAMNAQRGTLVSSVNTLSTSIASYNQKITDQEARGGDTSVLRDQRDELVKQMSSMMDVKVNEDSTGNYTVTMTNGQPLVNGKTAGTLATATDSSGNLTMSVSFDGTSFGVDPSVGGQLGALHDYETGPLKQMEDSVQGMAKSVADQFNAQLKQGFDLNGQPGKELFSFDASNPAGMLQVNDLSPEDLALSGVAGETGNSDNLQKLIGIKDAKVDIPGLGNMSLSDGAASIISFIGTASRENQTEADAASSVQYEAQNQRDNLSGVNQDEEAMNLQKYMQSYQSNLKVIAAGDQIFTDLLGLF